MEGRLRAPGLRRHNHILFVIHRSAIIVFFLAFIALYDQF